MPSLVAQLDIDLTGFTNLVKNQVDLLGNAGDALGGIAQHPPQGIGDAALLLRAIALPNIGTSANAQDGFAQLRQSIPANIAVSLGPLNTKLQELFGPLQGLLGAVTGGFAIYGSMQRLLDVDWSLEGKPPANKMAIGLSQRRGFSPAAFRGIGDSNIEAIEQWRAWVNQLPDPLTLSVLLEWAHEGLLAFPRGVYPFRYLPLFDELTDKLGTVHAWRHLEAQQLAERLGDNVFQLQAYIHRVMVEEGVGAVAEQVHLLTDALRPEQFVQVSSTFGQTLNALALALEQGDFNALKGFLEQLEAQKEGLDEVFAALEETSIADNQVILGRKFDHWERDMEALMLETMAALNPPQDTVWLNRLLSPLSELLEQSQLNAFAKALRELFDILQTWLEKINLEEISKAADTVGQSSGEAVQQMQNLIVQTTAELSGWMNDVRQLVDALPLPALKTGAEQALESFKQTVQSQVDNAFAPVRQTLGTTLSTIEGVTETFNPQVVADQFNGILGQLNSVLTGPQVLEPINAIKGALSNVNGGVANFSINTYSDPVVSAIDVVGKALGIAGSLPLTDSLKKDLEKALKTLKPVETIEALLDAILDSVHAQVSAQLAPNSVFVQFRGKIAELQRKLQEYSPSKLIGDKIIVPYNALLDQLEANDPKTLLKPVDDALGALRLQVEQQANPARLFEPLQRPYNDIMSAVNQFEPGALIKPLTDQLEEAADTLAASLPVDAINDALGEVQNISDGLQQLVAIGEALQALLADVSKKLSSFANADAQIEAIATELTAKLRSVQDLEHFEAGLSQLQDIIALTKEEALRAALKASVQEDIDRLAAMDASAQLAALHLARQRFTPALLETVPSSPDKTALQTFLSGFDPLGSQYTVPINTPKTWDVQLKQFSERVTTALQGWDERFHGPHAPFNNLIPSDTSPQAVQAMLEDALKKQILETFRPLFAATGQIQTFVAVLTQEVSNLLEAIEQPIQQLANATGAVGALRKVLDDIVLLIQNLDMSFVANTVQTTYEAMKNKLKSVNPSDFKAALETAFKDLLKLLSFEQLLGLDNVNEQYHRIVQNLRIGPDGKGIEQVLNNLDQNFKAIEGLLVKIDISADIETFLNVLLGFLEALEAEFDRIVGAYTSMYDSKMEVEAKASISF